MRKREAQASTPAARRIIAWYVARPNGGPAVLLDRARAEQQAANCGGAVVALVAHPDWPEPTPREPRTL